MASQTKNFLSAIILAKNEELMIADAIDSVRFCDEIIVVDNGSTDRTRDIARNADAQVYARNTPSFAELRNYGKTKAKGNWLLYLDADERVTPALQESIKDMFLEKHNDTVAYIIHRRNFYFGAHEWPAIERMLRLFKKSNLQEWRGELHETPVVEGKTKTLSGYIDHYTHQNLYEMVEKTNQWSEIEAALRLQAHHPQMAWWRFFRVMGTAFWDSYIHQKGYKAGTAGLVESMYQAFSIFITYAKLWEKQMGGK